MKYKHIPTGIIVHSDSELPPALYEPAEAEEKTSERKAEEPKKTRKRAK